MNDDIKVKMQTTGAQRAALLAAKKMRDNAAFYKGVPENITPSRQVLRRTAAGIGKQRYKAAKLKGWQ